MKYNIALKFIAIALCAAALLGMVVSGGGIFVLMEMNLYNKTVDEVVEERNQIDGENFARELALSYASRELGGCPQDMVDNFASTSWFYGNYNDQYWGYALKDAEGNVLESQNAEVEGAAAYTFPVSGQYRYLVNIRPKSEDPSAGMMDLEPGGTYDYIPAEGANVASLSITYMDGSTTNVNYRESLGFIYHRDDGSVGFWSTQGELPYDQLGDVSSVTFLDRNGDVLYAASQEDEAVGTFYLDNNGRVAFRSAGGTALLTEGTPVYDALFLDENGEEVEHLVGSSLPLGNAVFDENGELCFRLAMEPSSLSTQSARLMGILLKDKDGELIYEGPAPQDGGQGFLANDQGELVFFSSLDAEGVTVEVKEAAEAAWQAAEAARIAAEEEEARRAAEEAEENEDGEETDETSENSDEHSEETQDVTSEEETSEEETEAESAEAETQAENAEGEEDKAEDGETEQTPDAAEVTEETAAPTEETAAETTAETEAPEQTQATEDDYVMDPMLTTIIAGKPLSEYGVEHMDYWDSETSQNMRATYVYVPLPEYTVELYIAPNAQRDAQMYSLLRVLRNFRNDLFLALGVSALAFAVTAVYLCCAAGHKPKVEEVKVGGLNLLPLDLYLGLVGLGGTGTVAVCIEGLGFWMRDNVFYGGILLLGLGYVMSLLIVGFLFALVAQCKVPGYYWIKNTLCGRILMLGVKILAWFWHLVMGRIFPAIGRMIRGMGQFLKNTLDRALNLLPLTWQWLLAGAALVLTAFLCGISQSFAGFLLALLLCGALVFYGAKCFGTLMESARRMSKGNLNTKVEDKNMVGSFKTFAGDLNALADVAVVAAQKQLRSERMKTELITNVSHDIKTPLTSIINYVDLLQMPHSQEEQQTYLEVLARQSQRLKKLIEDLMDMSKASTGNMTVDIMEIDAVEAVNQALGEFAGKLDAAMLTPMFRHTEPTVPMMADGKLTWRVLSNLLSNAVKYALPGTRLYLDLMTADDKVVLSLKNISREELNVDAGELMERFVRGDDSRNTEGSGLGLNIAKSLMELQKGELELLVDGDLFKVTLIFPKA